MPLPTADAKTDSPPLSLKSTSSSTVIPCRRFDYVHVLLLVEQFQPLPSLPPNLRVIAQTESPIDLNLPSDDDTFLSSIDYSNLPTHIDSPTPPPDTPTPHPHSPHIRIAQVALHSALQSILTLIRRHYGAASHLTTGTIRNQYPVHLETLDRLQNPINPKGDSTYLLLHHFIRRPLSNQGKTQEAVHKVGHVMGRSNLTTLRLDYLDLSETTVPAELFDLGAEKRVTEVNLGFNHFLYFPPSFCTAFTGLTSLTLAGNKELFHVPAEIAKLTRLQMLDLTDCSNLISLPLTMSNMKSLNRLYLFGCVNLSFPPHAVAVRAQIATQEGQSEAGVRGVLDYIKNPLSWLSFNLNEAKKALASRIQAHAIYNKVTIQVLSFRKAYAGNYIEYEIHIGTHGVEWVVFRRFSQFRALVDELEKNLPQGEWATLTKLPGKTWSLHEEDEATCEERRKAMDALCEGLRQFEERNEKVRLAEAGKQAGKAGRKGVKGLNEMKFVRTFFEIDANVEI